MDFTLWIVRIASTMNSPRISQKLKKMDSAIISTFNGDQAIAEILLPMIRLTVPTAMQAIRRGSAPLHNTWVRIPLGRSISVSSCPFRTMEGKLPVSPRPKISVR